MRKEKKKMKLIAKKIKEYIKKHEILLPESYIERIKKALWNIRNDISDYGYICYE